MGGADRARPGPWWLPAAVATALRLVQIQAPILGVHSWRQADTAGLARNFHEQHLPLWLPQVDWGGAGSGFAETDFPIYSYAVSLLYDLFGVHEALARLLSLACSIGALLLLQRLGNRLLGPAAGWWGALTFAVVPLSVFYGRSVQPEALLLLAASLTLERAVAWHDHGRMRDLVLVGVGLGLASLIKVLPLLWLGIPLLWLGWCRHGRRLAGRPGPWLVLLAVVAVTGLWYAHAHGLYRSTGLSFGFWGARASRYSWADLLGPGYWVDVLLRFVVRGLAVLGLVPLVLGWRHLPTAPETRILPLGLGAVLLAGALAPASSHIHEYYQLPLLLFACPLVGLGCSRLARGGGRSLRWLLPLGLALVLTTSLLILSLDYWGRERPAGDPTWALAQRVQRETPAGALLVSVTGGDPTLLYLSHRKGWLQQPGAVDAALLRQRQLEGATHVVGLWDRIESYQPFADGAEKTRLRRLLDGRLNPPGDPQTDGYVRRLPLGQAP